VQPGPLYLPQHLPQALQALARGFFAAGGEHTAFGLTHDIPRDLVLDAPVCLYRQISPIPIALQSFQLSDFQECREYLKLESTKCYGRQTVLRFTPCLFGLYTIIVLLYLQLPDLLRLPSMMSWRGKSTTTFADMLMCVRRAIWQQWFFQTPTKAEPFSKLPRSLQETILYALAPAA
jgi:hypothetical protein